MRPKHRGQRPKRAGPTRGPAQLSLRRVAQMDRADYPGRSCSALDLTMPAAAAADIFPNVTTPACRARFRPRQLVQYIYFITAGMPKTARS
jgi:hypothetical protein